jgi:hypothetical protein
MKLWFRKVVKCGLCKVKTRKKDTFQLNMNTAEGPHQITICKNCAETMEQIKGNVHTWLEQ